MNQAKVEQVGTPQEVYDRPASPFVYQFLGDVNVLRNAAAWGATGPIHDNGRLAADGLLYVRPHDIAVTHQEPGSLGVPAIFRHAHTAGSQTLLSLELVSTRETVEAEISRSELAELNIKLNDLVLLRLRPTHTFQHDYAI